MGETMRPLHKILAETWQVQNPLWRYRLRSEEEAQDLLFMNYSCLYAFCQALPMQHKLYIYKYALLYAEGGVIADIDKECIQPMEKLISPTSNIYSSEDYKVLASHKGHSLWKKLLEEVSNILNKYGILDEYADNEFGELLMIEVMKEI